MNQNAIKALTEKLGRPTEAEGGPAPAVKLGRCECGAAWCASDGDHKYSNWLKAGCPGTYVMPGGAK